MARFEGKSLDDEEDQKTAPVKSGRFAGSSISGDEPAPRETMSGGRALWEGVKQGATSGFYDEAMAGATALIGSATSDLTYKEIKQSALKELRDDYANARKDHSILTGVGGVIGAIGTGLTGAGLLTKAAPKIAGGLLKFGTAHPYVASSAVGAISGGTQGFGEAVGDIKDRAPAAAGGAVVGGALGPVATLAGRAVIAPLAKKAGSAIKSGYEALTDMSGFKPMSRELSPLTAKITDTEVTDLSSLRRKSGELFSKTKGQRTQLPAAQRLEDDAIAGQFGPDAELLARRAQVQQSRERRQFLVGLGGETSEGINDTVEKIYSTIQRQSKNLKGQVNQAYDLAREGGGIKVNADDIKDGLFARIVQTKKDGQYDVGAMPHASKVMGDLVRELRTSQGKRMTSANLSALENWRKRVTNARFSSQDKTEQKFLGSMIDAYDDFMYKTANEAVDIGDKEGILAFRQAVSKRAEYGRRFEKNAFVEAITRGEKSIDDTVKDLIGTGAIAGKKQMVETVDAVLNAAGDERTQALADLQQAYARKLYKQSMKGYEPGNPESDFISAAEMKKALQHMFVDNSELAERLWGRDVSGMAKEAIRELRLIAEKQPGVSNPSGSFDKFARWMSRSKLGSLPGFNIVTASIDKFAKSGQTRELAENIADVIDDLPEMRPTASLWGGAAGGNLAGGVAAETLKKDDSYKIEVRPKRRTQ